MWSHARPLRRQHVHRPRRGGRVRRANQLSRDHQSRVGLRTGPSPRASSMPGSRWVRFQRRRCRSHALEQRVRSSFMAAYQPPSSSVRGQPVFPCSSMRWTPTSGPTLTSSRNWPRRWTSRVVPLLGLRPPVRRPEPGRLRPGRRRTRPARCDRVERDRGPGSNVHTSPNGAPDCGASRAYSAVASSPGMSCMK